MLFLIKKIKFLNVLCFYKLSLIRAALTFIDNTLVLAFNKIPARGPLFVSLCITYKCNAKCSFCNTHELYKHDPSEVPTEELIDFIRQLGKASVWHITITGGEVLLRKDLGRIIKEAKKVGLIVNVNTNGFLLESKASLLIDSGVDSITISLDSADKEVHDQNRGIPGLTEAIERGIEEVKRLRKGISPTINLRAVVSRQNTDDLHRLIDKYEETVDSMGFQPVHDGIDVPELVGEKKEQTVCLQQLDETESFLFEEKEIATFQNNYNTFLANYPRYDTQFNREFKSFMFDKYAMWKRYKCVSGFYYGAFAPNGKIYSCWALLDDFGDWRDSSFLEIWKGKRIAKWRLTMKNKGYTCLCWCGTSIVNMYMTNVFDNKIIRFFTFSKKNRKMKNREQED